MKSPLPHIILLFTIFVTFIAKAQTSAQYYCSVGGSYSLLRDQLLENWDNSGLQYSIGLVSEKPLHIRDLSFWFGVFYTNSIITDFKNSHFDYSTQAEVQLSTDIIRHDIQLQQLARIKFGKLKCGAGVLFSYLLSSTINQEVTGEYTPAWLQSAYQTEYTIENNRSKSVLSRTNIAPCINLEYQCSGRFFLNFLASYSIFPNPKTDYKFNSFNSLDLCLALNCRLNKTSLNK